MRQRIGGDERDPGDGASSKAQARLLEAARRFGDMCARRGEFRGLKKFDTSIELALHDAARDYAARGAR